MGYFKKLREQAEELHISVHNNLNLLNGMGKRGEFTMDYTTLESKLGKPIVVGPNEDGTVCWAIVVTEDGEQFNAGIYSDPNYPKSTPIEQMKSWVITAPSSFKAWQVEAALRSPNSSNIEITN